MKKLLSVMLTLTLILSALPLGLFSITASATSGNTTEFAGGSGTEEDPYLISTKYHLDNVRNYLTACFKMINDIEFTEEDFLEEGEFYNYGVCWKPIGDSANKFTGKFDGGNFEIRNLQIHKKNSDYVGLFGYVFNGGVSNLHLINVDVEGKNYVGSLCGYLHSDSVSNSSSVKTAYIESCYSSGSVVGYGAYTGGLCGYMNGTAFSRGEPGGSTYRYADAQITNSINGASVTGVDYSGGIAGHASSDGCVISSCANNGAVTATTVAGGILGYSDGQRGSSWRQSGLSGPVTMYYYFYYAILRNCVNKGNISAKKCGGIIGEAYYTTYGSSGTYNGALNSYSTGALTGNTVGGIIPCKFTGEIQNCFYLDTSASTYATSYGKSVSSDDLKLIDTFSSWNFSSVWTMAGDKNYKYPELQCFTLKGKVSLYEDVAYKEILTPNASEIENAYSDLVYEWFVDNKLVHTGETYTVADSDVGKMLKVRATSLYPMCLGYVESTAILVNKAQQETFPGKPELLSKTDAYFEIAVDLTQEYSIDNINWQKNGVFENLAPNKTYTVYSRILENDLYLLGESVPVLTVTTDRRPLQGTVSITGTSRYGDTLKADVSAVGPADATFEYEWSIGGTIVGTQNTYTVKKENIGKDIILSVKGTDDFIGTLMSSTVTATKATVATPIVPFVSSKTNTTVTLVTKAGYEYSKDKITWQDSPIFTGLSAATEYTFYQRVKETETAFASTASNGTKVVTLKNTVSAPSKPEIVDVTNTTVTLKKISGYEYSKDGLTWQTSNVFAGLNPFTEYSFCQRIAENTTDYASAQSEYVFTTTLKNSASAPPAPTVSSATDSSVTLTAISGYEYSKDGMNWQKNNVFSGLTVLKTYTFYQRIAETNTAYASAASPALSFKVKNLSPKTAMPVLKEKTNNTIKIETVSGCEYSINGQSWSTSTVFGGLSPNTVYSIYARKPETDTHYSGAVSDALVVTTLKNTVSKPSAPTLAGKTATTVTLTAGSGFEYSKNGTTWQTSNVFNGLSPNTTYTFYQRIAETATSYVSESSNALTVTTPKSTPNKPSAPTVYSKTYDTVTLNAISGYEYSRDGVNWQTSNVFAGLSPNTTYYFYQRIIETDTAYTSEKSSSLAVTTLKMSTYTPSKPVAVKVTQTSVELQKYTDYEYSKDGANWQTDNVFNNLSVNTTYTFYQRVAATNTTYAGSTSAGLQVKTNSKANCSVAPAKPVVAEITTSKVVLVAREGYEYSKNGTTWQTSNTFSGLSSNTSYTFYQRVAETGSELASGISTGVTVKTRTTVSGTTAATNYDKLRNYISTYGSTNSDGYKNLVSSQTTSSGLTAYYSVENISSGIQFTFLTSSSKSSKLVGLTQFTLTRSSKTLSTYTQLLYYYNGTCKDAVSASSSIDRSTYSTSKTYTLNQSGYYYITSSIFSENYNDTLVLLCDYWDTYFYSKLGFGLKGLGFVSYNGYGSTVCDSLCSYHSGSYETRNAYSAGCDYDGYTGDKYCTKCGTLVSSGTTISCTGQHSYSNSCDKTCNSCGEERAIEHTYSNDCDTKCNYCNAERDAHHVYNNECDANCNNCGHERKVSHIYDNKDDLICNCCGHERPPYTPGDLDDNDDVTDRDAVHLLYHTFLPDLYPVNQDCDFNNDGYVNDKDAVYLLYHTFLPDLYPLN